MRVSFIYTSNLLQRTSLYQGTWGTHSIYFTSIISPANPAFPQIPVYSYKQLHTSGCQYDFSSFLELRGASIPFIPFWTFRFDPSSHSLIFIPFYAPPQPLYPLNYGTEQNSFATNSSQVSRVWPEFPGPELQKYSVWLLAPFFWCFIGCGWTAIWREKALAMGGFPEQLLSSRFHLISVISSDIMRQYDAVCMCLTGCMLLAPINK